MYTEPRTDRIMVERISYTVRFGFKRADDRGACSPSPSKVLV